MGNCRIVRIQWKTAHKGEIFLQRQNHPVAKDYYYCALIANSNFEFTGCIETNQLI